MSTNPTTEREAFKMLSPGAQRVVTHLRKKGSISNVEAQAIFKMRALPRRIADLREVGYQITTTNEKDTMGQRYRRYHVADPIWRQPEVVVSPKIVADINTAKATSIGRLVLSAMSDLQGMEKCDDKELVEAVKDGSITIGMSFGFDGFDGRFTLSIGRPEADNEGTLTLALV